MTDLFWDRDQSPSDADQAVNRCHKFDMWQQVPEHHLDGPQDQEDNIGRPREAVSPVDKQQDDSITSGIHRHW